MLLGTLIAFFGFHSLTGERGLLMRDNLDREIAAAQEHLQLLKKENTQHYPSRDIVFLSIQILGI